MPLLLLIGLLLLHPLAAVACDICAVYTAQEASETRGGLRLGLATQYTQFRDIQVEGRRAANPDGERLDSSITQVLAGYTFHPRIRLQANLPLVHRQYRRVESDVLKKGSESGIGDLSLILAAQPWQYVGGNSLVRLTAVAGVKLPTGDARRLQEDRPEPPGEEPDNPLIPPPFRNPRRSLTPLHATDNARPSAIHGHDLALGTGSTDAILGLQGMATHGRWWGQASVLYTLRTRGAHDYRYANELVAQAGPGWFAVLDHRWTLGLQAVATVMSKGTDSVAGQTEPDTAYTGVYLGPAVYLTLGSRLTADLLFEIPAAQSSSGRQIVPEHRIRAGLVWRF